MSIPSRAAHDNERFARSHCKNDTDDDAGSEDNSRDKSEEGDNWDPGNAQDAEGKIKVEETL